MKDTKEIEKLIESILFVYGEPIALSKLSKISKYSVGVVRSAVENLSARLKETSGLRIIESNDNIQLVSNKEYAGVIESLFKREKKEELTKAALEVLAIVAYQGPVGRADIETIRGVNSSYILRNLSLRGLVNKTDSKKSFALYELSLESLKSLGLESQEDLPNAQKLKEEIEKAKNALNA